MGAGFIRRFDSNPGAETLGQIEGVAIIDTPPPGTIQGVNTGCVCAVGECADASYAVKVEANGDITSQPQPVRVYSPADIVEKIGGFDETIGNFGTAMGNLYASITNKRWPLLVLTPVDNITPASGTNKGIRLTRDLPTNASPTSPTPVVPMAPAVVAAGREFRSGSNRVRVARRVVFTDKAAFKTGTDGVMGNAATAVTQPFTSAAGGFTLGATPVQVGDIVVVGVIGTNDALNAKTFRVQAVTSDTALAVEQLSGATFQTATETALAFRIHPASTADSAGMDNQHVGAATANGYRCPARPLDATIAAGTSMTPTVTPDAATATSWDVLSGLAARVAPGTALTYSAAVHAPNAANSATWDARYLAAMAATNNEYEPANLINIIVSSRKSDAIRTGLRQHCADASRLGRTRRTVNAPQLSTATTNAAIATAAPGVGATRAERVDYSWPSVLHFVPDAVNLSVMGADGVAYLDGYVDDSADFWLASVEANTPPEENPGQAGPPFSDILAPIAGFARNIAPSARPGMAEYIALKAAGVCALRYDRDDGWLFQSGVTSDLTSGRTTIKRRRMADFIQDSIARATNKLAKKKATTSTKDAVVAQIDAFLAGLKSDNNQDAARIESYLIDDKSGNTPALSAAGFFVVITKVRLLASLDVIVLQTDIGEGVVITKVVQQ